MSTRTNTPNAQNSSTILAASNRISQIITNADLTPDEEAEVHALDILMFASTPRTRTEAAAVYERAVEHLECAADGVPMFDAWTLHRAFKAAQPLLAAA